MSESVHPSAWGHKVAFVAYVKGEPDETLIFKAAREAGAVLDAQFVALLELDEVAQEPNDQVAT